jgi:DNA-binding transcriptional LysR family regulator
MQIRFLEYLVALASECHFARAAATCGVSQPTLSAGLAALEDALGARLIERDRRYVGLTEEGAAALPWAKAILADHAALRAALTAPAGPVSGEIHLGVIPAAMPASGRLLRALVDAHPNVTANLRSMTSREIEAGLIAQTIHGGLTYLSHEPLAQVKCVPLARESYIFATRADTPLGRQRSVGWRDAASQPLCLLHQGMQNRRILDAHLAARGIHVSPVAVTDSYVTLIAMVEAGGLSTIISDSYAPLMSGFADIRALPFDEPAPANIIGLVAQDRPALNPLTAALLASAQSIAGEDRVPDVPRTRGA